MTGRLAGLALLLLSCTASALERIQLDWGTLESGDWRLEDVSLLVDWDASGQSRLTVSIAQAVAGAHRAQKLKLVCAVFELRSDRVDCRQGRLSLRSEPLNVEGAPASFHYSFVSGELKLTIRELAVAEGRLAVTLTRRQTAWQLGVDLQSCALAGLAQLLTAADITVPDMLYQGTVSGALAVRGDANGLRGIDWQLDTQGAGYSNPQGTQAAEGLALASSGQAVPNDGDWRLRAALTAQQGMLYADPLYLEFSPERSLTLDTRARWRADTGELQVELLDFKQAGVANGTLQGVLVPAVEQPLRQLDLRLEQAWLPGLYETWLQPWLAGSVLGELQTAGRLQGRLALAAGAPQSLELTLQGVDFREKNALFGVEGLDAQLHWSDTSEPHLSRLAWQSASFYRLQLGAAALQLETAARSLKMLQPLTVPLLDGTLHVAEFELGLEESGPRWLLDGMLTPVSMQAFSTALGWPELSGTLSGMVPKVRFEKGELTVGGVLLVQAFDGDVTVRNLRIRDPLGVAPRLWADVKLVDLDLRTLTRTFEFGRIEGRFEGEVSNLYMEAWQPVAFDAVFRTPPDDDSRHRISQKAVDNISNLGGAGMGGAVSRSFLRVLEDFPYKRLGIRCRLENGICHMGGVAPAERGYYLVQGTLLPPRLHVIGFSEQVDWHSLVQRLAAITAGGAPSVQ